ncbi:conserved hypothetical protein [Ricinus communis]|uniref:Uncharacterized protein n=1 Tax=Ricinus communis TaxID=3988 RepID=B9SUE2_RICCO|nr:conserved hypothetical protein [Ricinus communis]
MSLMSGVVSRQVLPACGSLCFFCPAMRARSRQPIKRYKKLIANIFPRNPDDGPNDRMIGRLCEYAAKNPLRIPKITNSLEQRCYKELRNENFQSAKIVMCIYRKLLISCREQMPLFASSLLSIMHTLLDQTRQDELQIVGCETLFDFVTNQKDGTYLFNLDGFIPKLCQSAQEVGDDERAKNLRAAALQALSSMVWLMGEHSHISVDFDSIVSVILENYGGCKKNSGNLEINKQGPQNRWVEEVLKNEGHVIHVSLPPEFITTVPSWRTVVNEKEVNVTAENARDPCFWSRVCLHNMAQLGKEATNIRRVLESLFRYFDNANLWCPEYGLAFTVLKDMQFLMDDSGQNTHILLSTLIKHLDHKNVLQQSKMQLDIVEVTTSLAQHAKVEPSVAIIGAVSDVMRHWRKSIHCSFDNAKLGADVKSWNNNFSEAVDKCLVELSYKVGDAGPILDVMAVMLENISAITVIGRTMISAVYRTAQIAASIPNLSYQNKAFPEALFHQLLPAMCHLQFPLVHPQPVLRQKKAALFEKLRKEKPSIMEDACQDKKENVVNEGEQIRNGMVDNLKFSNSQAYSKNSSAPLAANENSMGGSNKETEAGSLRLSSHQISLLLSSIWAQSIYPANTPENYEAIAHTYGLVLLFSRAKNSSHESLIRSFQLAFSLRNVALNERGSLPPSRRRSLFTLATSMILFSSKAYDIAPLVHCAVVLAEKLVDPFLQLVEHRKLKAVNNRPDHPINIYGSKEDDDSALKFLSEIDITGEQSREFFVAEIVKSFNFPDSRLSVVQEHLLNEFVPDDVCPLGGQFMDALLQADQVDWKNSSITEGAPIVTIDEDAFLDSLDSHAKSYKESAVQDHKLLSVNQLMESVLDAAHQVGRMSVTAPDVPYKEMALHCETLLMGKQKKMSNVINAQMKQDILVNITQQNHNEEVMKAGNPFIDQNFTANPQKLSIGAIPIQCATEYQHHPNFFRLPASSPYDHFLKAAGC